MVVVQHWLPTVVILDAGKLSGCGEPMSPPSISELTTKIKLDLILKVKELKYLPTLLNQGQLKLPELYVMSIIQAECISLLQMTFIFRFMSQNGINAVRIPVGWWIKYDPDPPKPFVGGSLQALDNAFAWASDNNIKVIVYLHAVPGSQNGNHHSATQDGFIEWGDSKIAETVLVIEFLAESLGAIELMNEPLARGVTLDSLKKYYQAGYDAVKTYTASAYVILSNRLGEAKSTELLPFAAGLNGSVIDVHYYNRYSDYFRNMNGQQNVDYIYQKRSKQLQEVTRDGGPLSFVGEWTVDLVARDASKEDYRRFAKAQLDVYGKATFGWAYSSYKCEQKYRSFKWMAENNDMKL